MQRRRAEVHARDAECYHTLRAASVQQHRALEAKQTAALEVNTEEDNIESAPEMVRPTQSYPGLPPGATFATQQVYATPSAFIRALIQELPPDQRLTRDQTLFLTKFAAACDVAYEDSNTPPSERRPPTHILLLGQGGSGKTHVVQKLVFVTVDFVWPPSSANEPTLIVVAGSNAQAKNISAATVKARTIHNATSMRVQKMTIERMAPGNKQAVLTRTWDHAMVLVIEEASMVGAQLFNMLSYRATGGRSKTHDVPLITYCSLEGGQYQRSFGRVPNCDSAGRLPAVASDRHDLPRGRCQREERRWLFQVRRAAHR